MRRTQRLVVAAAGLALATLAAACGAGHGPTVGSGSSHPTGQKINGGTVTIAENGYSPNFLFPAPPATNSNGYNIVLSEGLWPTLVYAGDGAKTTVNPQESLYTSMTWSDSDKVITIDLKSWKWSDGVPITSRDFTFMYNLLKANYNNWAYYVSGLFPADVTKVLTPNAHTVVLDLTRSYNPTFYTDDVLTYVPLMPQHAWDKTSMTGKVGNYDESPKGAKAVWNFLQKEGGQQSTFATNPLWQVVDGPFKLSQFDSSGYYAYVPNKNYSGDKPALSKVIWTPFTDDTALMDTLRSGTSISVSLLPLSDVRQIPALEAEGYSVAQVPTAGVADPAELLEPRHSAAGAPALHPAGNGVPDQPEADRPEGLQRLRRPWQRAGAGALRPAVGLAPGEGWRPVSVRPGQGHRAAEGTRLEGGAERHRHLRSPRHRANRLWRRDHRRQTAAVPAAVRHRLNLVRRAERGDPVV